ncbi:MAG: transglycosylase domain-containing protein [Myxococcales bacterium]|nr:transglycosylase domain-containing protein [Myxococcales bacterium]
MRRSRFSRRQRWLIGGVLAVVVLVVAAVLAYPRIGAWYVRTRAIPRLAARYGAEVKVGSIDVSFGHATLKDVRVRPRGGAEPVVRLDRIDVTFDGNASLLGAAQISAIEIRGGQVTIHRRADGTHNFDGLGRPPQTPGARPAGAGAPVRFRELAIELVDDDDDVRATVGAVSGVRRDGRTELLLEDLAATSGAGPSARAATLEVSREDDKIEATVAGGELRIWTGLSLTGIEGTVAEATAPGQLAVNLAGGYGGVAGTLWTARGWVEPRARAGEVRVKADAFSLDRLRPILEGRDLLVDYPKTTVDADLTIARRGDVGTIAGGVHVADLTINHPMLADKPVQIESLSGEVAATYDRATRTLTLTRGEFGTRGLPFSLTGDVTVGPRLRPARLAGRFVVPTVPCQQVLDALPPQVTADLAGFALTGMFATDLHLAIDWAELEATQLGGSVAINGCRARRVSPAMTRLKEPFEHWVEVETGEWLSFEIGPDNPDFVPLPEVSPYLLLSLQTTEDSAFYKHHGFIPREFRTALVKNLEAGKFKFGASSITMQTVKNVLLYRQKTLVRKFEELFLTWAIEKFLDKDRIFEIYVNAIEYGPALYGIGPAAREYFGKTAAEITPKEAAFFSSILPNPKDRYKQYCKGELRRQTEGKIARILAKMLERQRLTQEEYDAAIATPLVFVKDGTETEGECLRRADRALKNARPTNPLARPPSP